MKQILLNGKNYNMPENWYELSVQDLKKLKQLELIKEESINVFIVKFVNIWTNIPIKDILEIDFSELELFMEEMKWLNEVPDFEMLNSFIWADRKWITLHPIENDSLIKWILFDNLILRQEKIWNDLKDNDPSAIVKLLACVTHEIELQPEDLNPGERPLLLKYDGLDKGIVEEKEELFKTIPLHIALGFLKFFFGPLKDLPQNLTTSSRAHKVADYLNHQCRLLEPSDGNTISAYLLEVILLKEMQSLTQQLESSSLN